MYRPSGYNRIFCVAVSTELRCFEMPSLSVACCACAQIPDGALGKINAARKHRALAGYKRQGAICICKTINFLTKSFITNEQYEPRNADWCYITLCTHACQYIFLLEFLMNNLFSCCFEVKYFRKYIGLPRRIDRNEYYFALLYISFVRLQSHILPCSFGGTPRCFDVLKSHGCQDIR